MARAPLSSPLNLLHLEFWQQKRTAKMLGLRTDVRTMNRIIADYRNWLDANPDAELRAFLDEFIRRRYACFENSPEVKQKQESTAQLALDCFITHLNHDGDSSLLALLGALSQTEGFFVNPKTVMRRTYSGNQDIPSYIFGGYGISNLQESYRAAAQQFQVKLAMRHARTA